MSWQYFRIVPNFQLFYIIWNFNYILGQVNRKIMKLVFAVSMISMEHSEVKAKTGWLRIRMMCSSRVKSLPEVCCFSELALKKSIKAF